MTQPKTRKAAQGPATPLVDPLADLRDDPDARYPDPEGEQAATEVDAEPVALTSQAGWDAARAQTIAAWHADTVAVGFLHKGGRCGCHYLAGVALTAALPIQGNG